jgi:tetratricopeptide (TPR) repeat protein
MAKPLTISSDLLRPLAALNAVQQGAASYYRELRRSSDPVLQVAAWCALLESKLLGVPDWDEVVAMARYGAVRTRAFAYFEEMMEHGYARRVAEMHVTSPSELEQQVMQAQLASDPARMAELRGELYLGSGDINDLLNASQSAEVAAGWRPSLAWAVRMVAAAPLNPGTVQRMFVLLESSAQPDLLEEAANIFMSRNMYLQISQIFLAGAALLRGKPDVTLAKLKPLDDVRVKGNQALAPYLGAIRAFRAAAEEKLGNYRRAYDAFAALNEAERATNVDPAHYLRGIEVRAKLNIPALPTGDIPLVYQMLGFPRSGTTLLENILSAHPRIETFEEIPALTVAIDRIERVALGKLPPEAPEVTYAAARARYFEEIQSGRRKPDADVLVDKMPIRTADTALVSRLFPEWRYIFSIRHPFDVALSCFKQRFVPNPAMENFRSMDTTVRLYDVAMTEWFKVHTMDDPNVVYVRYDELVTDFERVTNGVFDFLGVPWHESVRDFSKAAEQRAATTPSYQKVRQGLSIGVQTAWRNYDFVFQSEVAKPLHKWAEFFGYPTE